MLSLISLQEKSYYFEAWDLCMMPELSLRKVEETGEI
jgi:hypothetical protein